MRILGVLTGVISTMLVCAVSAFADSTERNIMIDNFDANSTVRWDYVSDQVMGGVSEGSARLGTDNDTGDAYAHMVGSM